MAGMYIHIPFCKRRCLYCDFFSTTQLHRRQEYVEAVLQEIAERKDEAGEPIHTIYVGGGTPSQLDSIDIFRILRTIGTNNAEEVTMEVNPADVTVKYLRELRQCGVNRLSVGVQSFKDELLQQIGRRHNGIQAINAVHGAQEAGFDNISIDLMYALPQQTQTLWKSDIELALRLGVQHISSYGLMYEEGTQLTRMRDKGELTPVDENTENEMYDYLCKRLNQAGFEHYELSNWALPGHRSRHNSSYWHNIPYLGAGAAAHSFDGKKRWSNPTSLTEYLEGMEDKRLQREYEQLSTNEIYDEYVMTGLRTKDGIDLNDLTERFGYLMTDYLMNNAETHIKGGRLELINGSNGHNIIRLTRRGLFVSNDVMSDLMYI